MSYQDLDTKFLRKNVAPKKKQTEYIKPRGDVTNDGEKPFKKIGLDFRLALQKARQEKKLTQKELAQKLNVTQIVINGYESGKEIPKGNLINQMNRVLGVKLPKCK